MSGKQDAPTKKTQSVVVGAATVTKPFPQDVFTSSASVDDFARMSSSSLSAGVSKGKSSSIVTKIVGTMDVAGEETVGSGIAGIGLGIGLGGSGSSINPIIPGGVGGRNQHAFRSPTQSGGDAGNGFGIIGSESATTTNSNILISGNTTTTIHPPPGLISNAGMKTGRNGLGHRTMVVSPLQLGDAATTNNTTSTTTPKASSGTPSDKTTKVTTLKLSAQSSLYSPRPNISSAASNDTAAAATTTTTTTSNTATRQLHWFTPIKQDEKDGTKFAGNAIAFTSIATPTTVATTPSRSSIVMDNSLLLLSGGDTTPAYSDGGCFLSSICSDCDDDDTCSTRTCSSNAHVIGRGQRAIPAVVASISSNGSSGRRNSVVSPLPVLSDITNKAANNNAGDGFITPRKADRNTAITGIKPPTPIPTTATSTSRATSPAAVTPPPQNLKGDPRRQNKVKTELCLYYLKDVPCPFGERCNYAHGWDELRFKKLRDLERNGLIPNASQYRTHPCLSWITTGSCPFGQRCSSIHDPRVAGPVSSWMPYADSPVANLETTVNVEKFYHRHNSSLHASNPLVGQHFWEKCRPSTFCARTNGGSSKKGCFGAGVIGNPQPPIGSRANDPWGAREWKDTYGLLVCNLDALRPSPSKPSPPPSPYTLMSKSSFATALATASAGNNSGGSSPNGGTGAKKNLTEEQRLSIALLMSSGGSDMSDQEDYVYSPSHLVYGELCMILQTRYFRLLSADSALKAETDASNDILGIGGLNSVREISIDEYNASRTPWDKRAPYQPNSTLVARKITFGPLGETASVSLWFDIPSSQISPCTPVMVKRLKRVRSKAQILNGNKRKGSSSPPFPPLPFHTTMMESSGPSVEESFYAVKHQPFFYTAVANNDPMARDLVRDILLHRIRTLQGKDPALALSNEERILSERYFSLKRSMEKWQWPPCVGRGPGMVNENTKVPECTAKYSLPVAFGNASDGSVAPVWSSFLNASQKGYGSTESEGKTFDLSFGGALTQFGRPRLAIFRLLGEGISVPESEWDTPLVGGDFSLCDGGKDCDGSWNLVKDHYLGDGDSSSSSPETPSPAKRPNALPLGSSGEKRDSIFVKIQNASQ